MLLTDEERHAVAAFCSGVRATFGPRVSALTLFGSRARGDAHAGSDIDICLVIDQLDWPEKQRVYAIAGGVLDEHGIALSVYLVSAAHMSHLRDRERAIAAEIAQDGVPL